MHEDSNDRRIVGLVGWDGSWVGVVCSTIYIAGQAYSSPHIQSIWSRDAAMQYKVRMLYLVASGRGSYLYSCIDVVYQRSGDILLVA